MNKSWRGIACASVSLIIFMLLQCTFKDPEAPRWDVSYIIPLTNETYTMQELVEDEDDISVGQGQTLFYHVEQELDSLGATEFLSLGSVDTSTSIIIIPLLADTVWRDVEFNEGMVIDTTILRSGTLEIKITNRTDKDVELAFVLPFLHLPGQNGPYTVHTILSPAGTPGSSIREPAGDGFIDLSGALLHPKIENGKNVIQYGLWAVYQGPPTSFNDDVRIDLRMKDMVIQRFRGGLDELTVKLDTKRDTLDLPEELEGMKFGPIDALVQVESSFESIPGTVDFTVRGFHEDGTTASVSVNQKALQTGDNPVSIDNISDILNIYPKYLEFEGTLSMGEGYDEGHPVIMEYGDYMMGTAKIDIPLIFQFPPDWINETDVDTLDLYDEESDDVQPNEIFRDNVNSAGIIVVAENHLPIGAGVTLILSNTRGDSTLYSMTDPGDVVRTFDLKPGITGGGQGTGENPNIVTESWTSTFDFTLDKEEIGVFEAHEVYIGVRLELYETDGMIKVRPSDYITLKSRAVASLNTKIPEDDDEEGGVQ